MNEEHKKKIAEAQKRRWAMMTQEQRAAILLKKSEAMEKYWASRNSEDRQQFGKLVSKARRSPK